MIRSGHTSMSSLCRYSSQFPGIGRPAQLAALARRRGRAQLGVLAADLDVPELRVGHEPAIPEQRGSNAGPERDQDDGSHMAAAGPEPHLADTGGIGIVHDARRPAKEITERILRGESKPFIVDVHRGHGRTLQDHRGHAHPCRRVRADPDRVRDLLDEVPDHLETRLRGRRHGRLDAEALTDQDPAVHVDGRGLDAAPAEVDADRDVAAARSVEPGPRRVGRRIGLDRRRFGLDRRRFGLDRRRVRRVVRVNRFVRGNNRFDVRGGNRGRGLGSSAPCARFSRSSGHGGHAGARQLGCLPGDCRPRLVLSRGRSRQREP